MAPRAACHATRRAREWTHGTHCHDGTRRSSGGLAVMSSQDVPPLATLAIERTCHDARAGRVLARLEVSAFCVSFAFLLTRA